MPMLRKRVLLVAVVALASLLAPAPPSAATATDQLPAPVVGCNPDGCMFGTPPGVVHGGYRFQASSAPGAVGSVGWWEHFSEQPPSTYFIAALCNGTIPYSDSECGPWSAVHQVPQPLFDGHYTGTVNGYPCGGELPPCRVLERESRGNPTAQNPTSSASGLWQFVDGTWGGYGGYAKARHAPAHIQNDKAADTWAGGAGCSHWNACS